MKKYNIGLSAFFIVLASLIFYWTKDFAPMVGDMPGAGFWPRIMAYLLIFLSLLLTITTLLTKQEGEDPAPINFKGPEMKRVYIMLGIFAGYALVLYLGGFMIASLLFIPSVMYTLGERSKKMLLLISVSFTAAIYLVFSVLLRITLPLPFFM